MVVSGRHARSTFGAHKMQLVHDPLSQDISNDSSLLFL